MSYVVGYLDDVYDYLDNMMRSLKKHSIEFIPLDFIDDVSDINHLISCIMEKGINCIFVDYDLMKLQSEKWGTTVIKEILDRLSRFPCFLITNYVHDGRREIIVPRAQIFDKNVFTEDSDSAEFVAFINMVKNQIDCCKKTIELSLSDYEGLRNLDTKQALSDEEMIRLRSLYRLLSSYQYIDDIPEIFLDSSSKSELIEIVALLKDIDDKLEKK